ncbi:transcription elongation factor GreA [Paenibacillus guangzhouensis]|uniref:transcription elongation factor GreA n=1 Tax=Paenibacillus guangzhouensis TaxID=1473112 RepID=UPI0012677160|nr:transcription elongation factor GreA [Paenibacillus guangzhouensis]
MSNEEVILTPEGLAQLQAELDDLKYVKRKEIANRIKIALSYGDLKENSEYHAAKDDQAFMETRIQVLESKLKRSRVVDTSSLDHSQVNIGSTVVLYDRDFAEKVEYKIVGAEEADVLENKISYESPLGKALLGAKVGDLVKVDAPMGEISYEVLEIKMV